MSRAAAAEPLLFPSAGYCWKATARSRSEVGNPLRPDTSTTARVLLPGPHAGRRADRRRLTGCAHC